MKKKAKPIAAIPLERLLLGEAGRRNFDRLERERPRLERMLWDDTALKNLSRDKWERARAGARDTLRMIDALRDALYLNATANLTTRDKQSKKAKAPRVAGADGRTMRDIVAMLARSHPELEPRELWPQLQSAVEEWAGECEANDDVLKYEHSRRDGNLTTRTLSFKSFRQILSDIRK